MNTFKNVVFFQMVFLSLLLMSCGGCREKSESPALDPPVSTEGPSPEQSPEDSGVPENGEQPGPYGNSDGVLPSDFPEEPWNDPLETGTETENILPAPITVVEEETTEFIEGPTTFLDENTDPVEEEPPIPLEADLLDPRQYLDQGGTFWDAVYLGTQHVGYQSTDYGTVDNDGKTFLRIEIRNKMNTLRLGQPLDVISQSRFIETFSGELLGCRVDIQFGKQPIFHSGELKTKEKILKTITQFGTQTSEGEIPWKIGARTGGAASIQNSLFRNPILAEEERKITFYDPSNFSMVDAVLSAREVETVSIHGQPRNLRKVEAILKFLPMGRIEKTNAPKFYTYWTDTNGNIIRSSTPFAGGELITIRTTKEDALRFENESSQIDLGTLSIIPLSRPLENAKERKSVPFRVRLKDLSTAPSEISRIFPETPFQQVQVLSPDTVQITTKTAVGIDPGSREYDDFPDRDPTDADLGANLWITPNDSDVLEIAALAVPSNASDWRKALALEKWVHGNLEWETGSGFESSAEIAKNRKGDSTKYAFLLTALARSQKIPTRIAVGLVYTPLHIPDANRNGALSFHIWNEMLIEDIWIPLDATEGLGGANAARIKIADSDLETSSFVTLATLVMDLANNLEVEIVE